MNDVYQKLGDVVKLWQIEDAKVAIDSVEATEAWYSHENGKVIIQHRSVGPAELSQWLQQTTKPYDSGVMTLVMRLVWVKVDPEERHFNVSKSTRKTILASFGLDLAYTYFQSFVTGATAMPEEKTANGPRQAYAFSYTPKLAAIWSATRRPPPFRCDNLTEGVIFVREAEKDKMPVKSVKMPEESVTETLRKYLSVGWDPELIRNAMFPAYLLAMLLGIQIDLTQQVIKQKVQSLERRTGYHGFESRLEKAADEELQSLPATASGLATKLASVERKSKTVEQILAFALRRLSLEEKALVIAKIEDDTSWCEGIGLLRNQIEVLKYRHDMQVLDTEYIMKRVEIQIQAVFHIIAQDDAITNYQLSHHMSQTAEFSYRDAASMKTLAVVTMFFLPGSFVSALFSTELFAWDSVDQRASTIGVPTTPQLTLYWAVTIPLTVLTFLLYFLWLWYQKRERERNFMSKKAMDNAAKGTPGHAENVWIAEGIKLAERRKTFFLEQKRSSQKV